MNVAFIKWMCDKAEGFDYREKYHNCIVCPNYCSVSVDETKDGLIYPLLLQRAIEGVNEHDKNIVIVQDDTSIEVVSYNFTKEYYICDGIDKAKESALMYIYNQEKNKNAPVQ